ncbi:hypothetical protein [Desulfosediminicola ganghwensis]|uniref:hypothetical protein n=1 Tax=Desulfosediminicola ganghwensis TaxID=2569540 RepID=UPI0010ABD267|nr:hypothetical protein [Desulfosediminicola ganghwensis]
MTEEKITQTLTYAGFILVAFELAKGMIVNPIETFYKNVTFDEGMPFKSYKQDVLSRHKNKFEASLLYLRDFMQAIDAEDVMTIQALRKHRNILAHELPQIIQDFDIAEHLQLLEKTEKALFKLSNHRAYMEFGTYFRLNNIGTNWDTVKGPEYCLFEEIVQNIKFLEIKEKNA